MCQPQILLKDQNKQIKSVGLATHRFEKELRKRKQPKSKVFVCFPHIAAPLLSWVPPACSQIEKYSKLKRLTLSGPLCDKTVSDHAQLFKVFNIYNIFYVFYKFTELCFVSLDLKKQENILFGLMFFFIYLLWSGVDFFFFVVSPSLVFLLKKKVTGHARELFAKNSFI